MKRNNKPLNKEKKKGEKCAHLGYYAASSGNSLPTFRDKLSVPSSRVKNLRINNSRNPRRFLTLADGTYRLFRNVGKELPILAASR
jgi:hypothetical protein